ncbi:MAG: SEC-C metal-binding domain-containing protein [Bacillota bacterium]
MKNNAFTVQHSTLVHQLITKVTVINPINNKSIEVNAIWDTGATSTCITNKVVNDLGLEQTGVCTISTASGISQAPRYGISLKLPNNLHINPFQADMVTLHDNVEMLIGMNIITTGDFALTNHNNKTTLSFVFPSMGETDYVKILNGNNSGISRNALCPCGSGKKYKKCCGSN